MTAIEVGNTIRVHEADGKIEDYLVVSDRPTLRRARDGMKFGYITAKKCEHGADICFV